MKNCFLYSAVDNEITQYGVDVDAASLTRGPTLKVADRVQYAYRHPRLPILYVSTSNRGPGLKADSNFNTALHIDVNTGALTPIGDSVRLNARAVHICVTPDGHYLLSAHNLPNAGITVHRINNDGTIGEEQTQTNKLDFGIYPHQVMASPSNRSVILVDRGNEAHNGKPEDPGALRAFRLENGRLSQAATVAPNGGFGFGPRHIDFHPTLGWIYANLEIQSELQVFSTTDDLPEAKPKFICDLLNDRADIKPRQLGGPIHFHPNGRFLYLVNRTDWKVDHSGTRVFGGGENNIAVFDVNPHSGEPKLIQHADTHAFHVRTFSIDPGGRLLVAASIKPISVVEGGAIKRIPAALSVFRINGDGRLEYVRKYDVDAEGRTQYWTGMIGC